jgi:hypothetical protein
VRRTSRQALLRVSIVGALFLAVTMVALLIDLGVL